MRNLLLLLLVAAIGYKLYDEYVYVPHFEPYRLGDYAVAFPGEPFQNTPNIPLVEFESLTLDRSRDDSHAFVMMAFRIGAEQDYIFDTQVDTQQRALRNRLRELIGLRAEIQARFAENDLFVGEHWIKEVQGQAGNLRLQYRTYKVSQHQAIIVAAFWDEEDKMQRRQVQAFFERVKI